jgi:hypothetical protein
MAQTDRDLLFSNEPFLIGVLQAVAAPSSRASASTNP